MQGKLACRRGLAAVTVLLFLLAGCSSPPEDLPDGYKAYEHIEKIDKFGPRPLGSTSHDKVATYIYNTLETIGYLPEISDFEVTILPKSTEEPEETEDPDELIPQETGMLGPYDDEEDPDELDDTSGEQDNTENEPGSDPQESSDEDAAYLRRTEPSEEEQTQEEIKYAAHNIYAFLPGKSERIIVLVANYDSKAPEEMAGNGCDDNASGVAVLLEVAERLYGEELPCGIQFAFVDAQENGMLGSRNFLETIDAAYREKIRCVVNVDAVAVGDKLYAYGGIGPESWVRERAMALAEILEIELLTTDGSRPNFPAGTTGEWSDHAPFARANISFVYLEGTNWDIGAKDGNMQTEKEGMIFQTERDTFEYIEEAFPGRILQRMTDVSRIVEALCRGIR